jgi:molybdopterin-guanine dinucleotide biosynthesis protein A
MARSTAARIGIILAGGRASRMGGEKALIPFRGRPLIEHVIERAQAQVDELLINTNEPERFHQFGCLIVEDQVGGFQ